MTKEDNIVNQASAPAAKQEVVVNAETKLSDLTDRQILELTQNIKDAQAKERPLVGTVEIVDELRKEYEDGNPLFVEKIKWLEHQGWSRIRRLRGDGNCFYRAFAFGFCERILQDLSPEATAKTALSKLDALLPILEQVGFERMIFEDFYDPLKHILTSISKGILTSDSLFTAFNNTETSASIVVFLRLLTSAYLRQHEEDVAPYLFAFEDDVDRFPAGPPSLHEYCQYYVEAVDKDADHLSITALTRCLDTKLSVAYLDLSTSTSGGGSGSGGGGGGGVYAVDFHTFETENNDGSGPKQTWLQVWDGCALLYRPGHYDLIYLQS